MSLEVWETTKYAKWYKAHRRFSFTANFCIEQYEEGKSIPQIIFKPFLKSLACHSKSEEKMFQTIEALKSIFQDHETIQPMKVYTNEEKYTFCKKLLHHMKEEEYEVMKFLKSTE